jgi:hypothetical protein
VWWQAEISRDAFMILCLRCDATTMTERQRRAIIAKLEDDAVCAKVREALELRQRWQHASEFPIVGGADVADLDELLKDMVGQLKQVVGASPILQVGTRH